MCWQCHHPDGLASICRQAARPLLTSASVMRRRELTATTRPCSRRAPPTSAATAPPPKSGTWWMATVCTSWCPLYCWDRERRRVGGLLPGETHHATTLGGWRHARHLNDRQARRHVGHHPLANAHRAVSVAGLVAPVHLAQRQVQRMKARQRVLAAEPPQRVALALRAPPALGV